MANQELSSSGNQDIPLSHNLEQQMHGHNTHIGISHHGDLGLSHESDNKLVLGQGYEYDTSLQHAHNVIEENRSNLDRVADGGDNCNGYDIRDDQLVLTAHHHDFRLSENHDSDYKHGDHDSDIKHNDNVIFDDQLVPTSQHHDIGMLENHELAFMENHNLYEELNVDGAEILERSIVLATNTSPHHTLQIDSPVLQSRDQSPASNHELKIDQAFPDVHSCRRALRNAAIALCFEMQTIKSDKNRFTAKCASEGCPWRIHAAKLPGVPTFTIRTINGEHTCHGIKHLGHQQASVQWVADTVAERLMENPSCKPKEILEEIHRVHGIALTYKQAWRGKERIMATVRGSFDEEYRLLPQYCDQIRRTNPGSIVSVYGSPVDSCFQRLFVSFQASIHGFLNACRPLIGLDRFVLRNKHGTMLLANSFDGEDALFPLAFGVVDEENNESWDWFLSELRNLLEINAENMPKLTILSDRQVSIVEAVLTNFPTAFHGLCMTCVIDRFQKQVSTSPILINLVWEVAYALNPDEFQMKIHEIENISLDAALWFSASNPSLWATAFFEGTRFGHLTANVIESPNSLVYEASGLPIIQMIEYIRRQLMIWFNSRREASMQWTGILVPSGERHVTEALEQCYSYQVAKANEAEFAVMTVERTKYVVDIRIRSCSCGGWQLRGYPCSHAASALHFCNQNVYRFTETYFTVANYRKAYSETIHPIPDKALWKEMMSDMVVVNNNNNGGNSDVEVVIRPPKSFQYPPGRPKKRRVHSEQSVRVKRVVHCSRCNQPGHFRTTCTIPA